MSQPLPSPPVPSERDLARRALTEQAARAEAARTKSPRFLVRGAPDLGGFSRPLTGWPSFGLESAPEDAAVAAAFRDSYLSARGQLAARRVRRRLAQGDAAPVAGASDATPAELQAVLQQLQLRPLAFVHSGGRATLPTLAHVRQDLQLALQQRAQDGRAPQIGDADDDALELIGALLETLVREHADLGALPMLLARLQIPVLRVALSGPQFLLDRNHPARRFLASVVEHASGWLGADPADQATAAEISRLVERAVNEFRGDASLFDQFCAELAAMHTNVQRKAQLAERRHIDAVAGRDRLEDARAKARAAIALRLARGAPTPLVRALLEQDWTRVLALALAREGAAGPMVASCLAAADRLIDAFAAVDRARGGRIDLTEEQFLRQTLSIGLARVGYHGGDLQLILERLFSDDPRAHLDADLPLRQRTTAASDAETDNVAAAPAAESATAREQSLLAMIRGLPPGTWIEVVPASGGASERRKLAWVSASGAPCPLLNWRGAKVAELTSIALARALSSGHVRVLAREDGTLLDHAVRRLPLLLRERQKGSE